MAGAWQRRCLLFECSRRRGVAATALDGGRTIAALRRPSKPSQRDGRRRRLCSGPRLPDDERSRRELRIPATASAKQDYTNTLKLAALDSRRFALQAPHGKKSRKCRSGTSADLYDHCARSSLITRGSRSAPRSLTRPGQRHRRCHDGLHHAPQRRHLAHRRQGRPFGDAARGAETPSITRLTRLGACRRVVVAPSTRARSISNAFASAMLRRRLAPATGP